MYLNELFNPRQLRDHVINGFVHRSTHPKLPLSIYCYTSKAYIDHVWDEVTRQCRGLVVDDITGEVVALPFPKFFNSDQHTRGNAWAGELPSSLNFEAFSKVDGSLSVFFWYQGAWRTATKGSFATMQAELALGLLNRGHHSLDTRVTYLAELIHPYNRIVVDYGGEESVVLLGGYDLVTGDEIPLNELARDWEGIGPVVRSWGVGQEIKVLEELAEQNRLPDGQVTTGLANEGVVVRYENGLRVKIKLSEYLALHKSLTCVSERNIWSTLASGAPVEDLYADTPDEFHAWVESVVKDFKAKHAALVSEVVDEFDQIMDAYGQLDRKEFAVKVDKYPYKGVLFMLYDGNGSKIDSWAWKMIKPKGRTGSFALAAKN